MDSAEARVKAEPIDFQKGQERCLSWTQKLKLYNMSSLSQKIIMWLLVGLYFVSLLTNILTFISCIGIIPNNLKAPLPNPL